MVVAKKSPTKIIRDFCGKPIIAYPLETAKASGLFDVIHVSTDDDAIARVVAELGFPVHFMRPDNLSDDAYPTMPVLKSVVDEFAKRGETFVQICLLLPCAPLVDPDVLKGAAEMFDKAGDHNPVTTITPLPVPVEWTYRKEIDGLLTLLHPGRFTER